MLEGLRATVERRLDSEALGAIDVRRGTRASERRVWRPSPARLSESGCSVASLRPSQSRACRIYCRDARRHLSGGDRQHPAVDRLQRARARRAGDRRARRARPVRDGEGARRATTRCCAGRSRCSRSSATPPARPIGISLLNKRIGVVDRPAVRGAASGDTSRASARSAGPSRSSIRRPRPGWWPAASASRPSPTLAERSRARGVPTTLFYGARARAELFYLDFFETLGVSLVLDDRRRQPRRARPDRRATRPRAAGRGRRRAARWSTPAARRACWPRPRRSPSRHGTPCEVSVERVMGCGMGGCYSCVVPMRGADGRVHHVRSCLAGPVLAGRSASCGI